MTCDWLLAVGCSLTWGSEITSVGKTLPEDKEKAWPTELGNLLGANYTINRGWPGRSNGSIFRIAMQDMAKYQKELGANGIIVVQWSGIGRIEIVNPFVFDFKEITRNTHPGQEPGPYLSLSISEILKLQKKFPGLYDYYINYWGYELYQTELLINKSIALSSLANKLGIKILQFNGIDLIKHDQIPKHARDIFELIRNEYYYPQEKAFWPLVKHFPGNNIVPRHPTAEDHTFWAKQLYEYLLTI